MKGCDKRVKDEGLPVSAGCLNKPGSTCTQNDDPGTPQFISPTKTLLNPFTFVAYING
jgi:hypothetical protein